MCCDYNLILIIFIILYNIIDVYNRHIKVKEDNKKREEFKTKRKELINYIYKTYSCLNYKIINEKINKLQQLLIKNNKTLNIKKLLLKIKKELIQIQEKEYYELYVKTNNIINNDQIYINARTMALQNNQLENLFNIVIKQIDIGNDLRV
jgi:hypothetical protein